MKRLIPILAFSVTATAISVCAADPALTIYNANFAVVRDTVHLDLKQGLNTVSYNEATMHLEPDSVVLRDPTGKSSLQILEQNFRADPVSQGLLLNYYEGKTIEFEVMDPSANGSVRRIVNGKIIRSGYVPHSGAFGQYGQDYESVQANIASPEGAGQAIVEVDGKLMFRLPGEPLFPALADDSILKPTLTWQLSTDKPGATDAELSYITGGMSWHADYNVVAPETGDTLDLVGWVTMNNQSGKSFQNAKIKLMAGDVNKIQPAPMVMRAMVQAASEAPENGPAVTEKAFDEYHLYTLERPATLQDRETKQVEFIRAEGIKLQPIYTYDGAEIDSMRYGGWNYRGIRDNSEYGTDSNTKVSVVREFTNSAANHLGIPLPKGRLRLYRRDADSQMEFTGENTIDHTPRDEVIRVNTGNAFDLVGERKRTDYKLDSQARRLDESFQITVRNHKKTPAEVRIVEHLYRWPTWEIAEKSADFRKTDSNTIEFRVPVEADGTKTVTYTAHYSW